MTQKQGWKFAAAAAVALGLAFSPIAAMALDLSFSQVGGFTLGSAQSAPCSGPPCNPTNGVEFFGATGFNADASSPNAGQPTYGQIGWGVGNANVVPAQGFPSGPNNTVAPASPVTGLPALPGQPAANWPTGFRSALDLDVFSGTLTVGDPNFTPISSLQHYNRTIGQTANTLSRIDIDTLLTLDTIPPTGSDSNPGFVRLGFNETLNAADPCPAGGTNPCADIFSFETAVFNPVVLTIGGKQYLVEFNLSFPINTVDERTGLTSTNGAIFPGDPECQLPAGNICTAENRISEAIIGIRVTALAVPAPASLLLLGFGLSGLGVAGWLRRK